jgi:ADP-ribosylglycohydrolase
MRVAPLGAFFCDDPEAREAFVEVSTRMTHTDPRALTGARAIAATAAWIMRSRDRKPPPLDEFCALLSGLQPSDSEWRTWIERLENGLRNGVRVDEFAGQGRRPQGVSGYIYHTVPVVLFAWYRHFGDFEATLESVLDCGGDTDTTGAIAGALAGLTVGEDGIPRAWIAGVNDWPRGVPVLRQVADRLAAVHTGEPSPGPVSYPWAAIPLRNLVFLLVVLLHGFRRLFPPY